MEQVLEFGQNIYLKHFPLSMSGRFWTAPVDTSTPPNLLAAAHQPALFLSWNCRGDCCGETILLNFTPSFGLRLNSKPG